MHHALGFRNIGFFLALIGALSIVSGPGLGQTPRPSPTTSPYSAVVNCPDANTLVVDITPNTLPAGWTSSHTQLELRVADASPSAYPPGKQALVCHYKAKDCAGCTGGADTLMLKRIVDLGACMNSVPGQPKKSFFCKPGAVQ